MDAYWPNFSKKAEDSPEKAMGDSDEHEGGEPGAEVECLKTPHLSLKIQRRNQQPK